MFILNAHTVILSEAKNLLSDYALSMLSLVDFEGMLRVAQHDTLRERDCHVGQSPPRNDANTINRHSEERSDVGI